MVSEIKVVSISGEVLICKLVQSDNNRPVVSLRMPWNGWRVDKDGTSLFSTEDFLRSTGQRCCWGQGTAEAMNDYQIISEDLHKL